MIRSVRLVCAECGSEFVPEGGVLYYKDNYINNTVKEAKFICPACIKKWHEKWHIKNAGAYGAIISGAGSTLMAYAAADADSEAIGRAMQQAFEKAGQQAVYHVLKLDEEGARVIDN